MVKVDVIGDLEALSGRRPMIRGFGIEALAVTTLDSRAATFERVHLVALGHGFVGHGPSQNLQEVVDARNRSDFASNDIVDERAKAAFTWSMEKTHTEQKREQMMAQVALGATPDPALRRMRPLAGAL
jgi:hypothetical protein